MTENNTRNPTRPSQKRFLPQASALGLVLFALVLGEFGFRAFRDKGWRVYPPQDGLAHGQVQAIATGPDGAAWVGSERGLSRFDGQAWTIWTERDGLPDGDIRSISISVDGMVWLCTGQGYVRLVDGEWASYKRLDIVLRNWIMFMEAKENEWPIAVAPDGSLWFGTDNGALHFSEPQASGGVFPTWTLYDKNDGLPDASVLSIAIGPEGEVWVGTERGVARYDGQVWRTYSKRDGLAHDRVIAVAVASDGTAWFSTRRGLSRFDGQSWKTLPLAALGLRHSPKALAVDGQHRLWMETHKGIGAWDEHEGAPLWVLRTWLFLRMVLGGASFILAAVLVLDSAWGKRFVRLAGDWIRSRWLRLKAFLSGMWARSCNVVLAIRPRDSLNRFVLHHRTTLVPIAFLVLFSLLLRFWQLDYGQMLPYVAHADEHTQYNPAIRVVRDGEFNPHFFNYPSLTIYIDALVLAVASRLGIWFGVLDSLDDLQLIRTAGYARGMLGTPGMLWLGRATTAVFGALTAALVFILAGQLAPSRSLLRREESPPRVDRRWLWGATAAGLLLALSMEHIRLSHYMTVDVIATFFVTASILFCTLSLKKREKHFLWWAAVCGGLATASKYNYAVLSIPVALSVMFDPRLWANQKIKRIWTCGILFCLAFVLTSPYVLLDFKAASEDISYEMRHYSQGHLGHTGDSLAWYINYFWSANPFYLLLGVSGMIIALWRHRRAAVPLVSFAAIYFGWLCTQSVHFDRNALPVLVLFITASGIVVDALLGWLPSKMRDWQIGLGGRRLSPIPVGIVCIALLPSLWDLPMLRQSAYPSGQAQAQAWFDRALETEIGRRYLNDSLPSALRIAAEGYTIYLDPDQYRIKYLTAATDIGAPADFIRQGYDMVLLGSGMYNRFYDHPGVFAEQVDIYDTFFNGDWEVMVFEHPYDPLAFAESRSEVHLFFLTKEAKQFKAEIQANQ